MVYGVVVSLLLMYVYGVVVAYGVVVSLLLMYGLWCSG